MNKQRITEIALSELRANVAQLVQYLVAHLTNLVKSKKVQVSYGLQTWTFSLEGLIFDISVLQDERPALRVYRESDPAETREKIGDRTIIRIGRTPLFEFQETISTAGTLRPLVTALRGATWESETAKRADKNERRDEELKRIFRQHEGLKAVIQTLNAKRDA
jgi:hypothetical protein